MAADLFRRQGNGGERILDLVRHPPSDLPPGELLLRAQQFGGVLQHQHVAVMGAFDAAAGFQQRDRDLQVHGASAARAVPRGCHLHLARGRAHAMAAPQQVVKLFHRLGGEDFFDGGADEGGLAAGVEHLRESAVGQHHTAPGVQRGNAIGDGLEHRLQFAAACFQRGVGLGELGIGSLDRLAAAFQVGGHMVEAADQFAELFGGALSHATRIVAGGDRLHCVGQRFHRLGHLLGEVKRQPTGGEQRQAGQHQQQQQVQIAHLAALAVGDPVVVHRFLEVRHGGRHALRHGQSRHHRAALLNGGGTKCVVHAAHREDGKVRALGHPQDGGVQVARRMHRDRRSCGGRLYILVGRTALRDPRLHLRRAGGALRHVERSHRVASAIDNGKAAL